MFDIPRIALAVAPYGLKEYTACHSVQFLSITQRLGQKTICGWTIVNLFRNQAPESKIRDVYDDSNLLIKQIDVPIATCLRATRRQAHLTLENP